MYIEVADFKQKYEIEFEVKDITYYPECPAPDCQNPNDSRYADFGQSEEFEYRLFLKINGKIIEVEDKSNPLIKLYDIENLLEQIEEDIRDMAAYHTAKDDIREDRINAIGGGR